MSGAVLLCPWLWMTELLGLELVRTLVLFARIYHLWGFVAANKIGIPINMGWTHVLPYTCPAETTGGMVFC